jgi:flavorubredoxin
VPVFFCSAYGHTEQLGRAIREGILEVKPRALCELHDLTGCDMAAMGALLNASDAFLLGSPTINRDAVPPLWELLAHVDAVNSPKCPCALFGSYGWSGEALPHLAQRLEQLKCKVFEEPLKVNFAPSEDDLAGARAFGRRFAEKLVTGGVRR